MLLLCCDGLCMFHLVGRSCDPTYTLWLCIDTALALSLLSTGRLQAAIDRIRLEHQ